MYPETSVQKQIIYLVYTVYINWKFKTFKVSSSFSIFLKRSSLIHLFISMIEFTFMVNEF